MRKQLFLILLTVSFIAKAQNNTDTKQTESQKRMTEFSKAKRHNPVSYTHLTLPTKA